MSRRSRLFPRADVTDLVGRRIDSFTAISSSEAGTLVSRGALAKRLAPIGVNPLPPVTSDMPTVSWSSSPSVNGRVESPLSANVTPLGRRGTWDSATGVNGVGAFYSGKDYFIDGDTLEFSWREQNANGTRLHIFVDGAPLTATPYAMNVGGVPATAAGTIYYTKLVWGTAKRRRITIYSANMFGWAGIRLPVTSTITPAPEMPRVAVVGDSFNAGSAATEMLLGIAVLLGRLLGVDIVNASYGGTGYVATNGINTFGSAARLAVALERAVAAIVFMGSVNDTLTGLGAAAAQAYASYAAAAPGVPIIVFGVQPSNASDTVGSSRAQCNDVVRQAALANPAVIAFHDMIGLPSASAPAAYSSSTTYVAGDRATYQGSVWRVTPSMTGSFSNIAPGSSARWELETYMYTGTGTVASPAGNGTRDLYLNGDSIHPQPAGSLALAQRVELEIRRDLNAL